MQVTLGSLASPEKPVDANIKNRKYLRYAVAILTITSLRTSDGFMHNVAEFSKGKTERKFLLLCVVKNVIG